MNRDRVYVPLFADLKRHDMGPGLAENAHHEQFHNAELTTAPLWGVRNTAPNLHDGLALDIWHRVEDRVRAHVLVATLALACDRVLQRKLQQAGLELLSSQAAWTALETVSVVEFELPGGQTKAGVCVNGEEGGPGSEAYQVLQALGAKLEAPQPPEGTTKTVY